MDSEASEQSIPVRWVSVAVYGFASLVFLLVVSFEVASVSVSPHLAEVLSRREMAESIASITAQVEWRAMTVLFLGALVGAFVVGAWNLWLGWRRDRRVTLTLLLVGVVVGMLVSSAFGAASKPTSMLHQVLQALAVEPTTKALMLVPKFAAEVIAGLVGMGFAAVLILPEHIDAEVLSRHFGRLRAMLFTSAAMLAIGVLMTHSAYGWAVSFVTHGPGEAYAEPLAALGASATHLAGSVYTLILAAVYIPGAFVLDEVGRRVATEATQHDENPDPEAWLELNGLRTQRPAQIGRLFVILAPLLSSLSPKLLGWVT